MYCDLQKLTQSAGLKMAKNWCIITKYFEYKNVKKVDFSLSSKPKHCRVASLNSKETFFLDFKLCRSSVTCYREISKIPIILQHQSNKFHEKNKLSPKNNKNREMSVCKNF